MTLPIDIFADADVLRIPVGPGSVHVDRYGHGGVPVVLLHGFGTSAFLWRAVGPKIADAGHTAFAVDMLGHGESDRPFDAEYDIAAQAEYLDHALTALRIAKAVIVGVDIGGGVALRLAGTRPDRVRRLVLINTVAFDEFPGKDITSLQRGMLRMALRSTRGVLGASPMLTPLLRGSVANAEKMPDRLVARYLAPFVGRDGVEHLLVLARSIREEDLEELDLRTIHSPTLVVWGEEDKYLDPKIADRLINAIPDSRLVKIPAVGRLVPEEAPDQLSELLLDFITERGVV